MKVLDTFTATVYVGFHDRTTGFDHTIRQAEKICQEYCNRIGLCVTVTPTKFIYTNSNEYGVAIGFINYPRFPDDPEHIKKLAIELGGIFVKEFNQFKVSIVCSDKTYMVERNNAG